MTQEPIRLHPANDDKGKSIYLYIGQRIKERRKLLKMNQAQLGQLMGFSYQQMQKYENGLSEISVGKLLRFAKILNVPPEFFYDGAQVEPEIGQSIASDIIPKTYNAPLRLLLIESNPHDVIQFKKALSACREPIDVHVLHDPEIVNDFLQNHDLKYGKPEPDLVILDVTLPKMSGMQILRSIKKNPRWIEKPVVVLTNSVSRKEMQDAYRSGAAGFVQKRVDPQEYAESIQAMLRYWSRVVALPRT